MTSPPTEQTYSAEPERAAFFDAIRTSTQTMPGLFAWGVVTGAAMMQSGLSLWQSLLMTLMSTRVQRNWRLCLCWLPVRRFGLLLLLH